MPDEIKAAGLSVRIEAQEEPAVSGTVKAVGPIRVRQAGAVRDMAEPSINAQMSEMADQQTTQADAKAGSSMGVGSAAASDVAHKHRQEQEQEPMQGAGAGNPRALWCSHAATVGCVAATKSESRAVELPEAPAAHGATVPVVASQNIQGASALANHTPQSLHLRQTQGQSWVRQTSIWLSPRSLLGYPAWLQHSPHNHCFVIIDVPNLPQKYVRYVKEREGTTLEVCKDTTEGFSVLSEGCILSRQQLQKSLFSRCSTHAHQGCDGKLGQRFALYICCSATVAFSTGICLHIWKQTDLHRSVAEHQDEQERHSVSLKQPLPCRRS